MSRLGELATKVLEGSAQGPAIQYGGEWLDWESFRQAAHTIQRLADEAGAHPGAAILIIARNEPGLFAALLGSVARSRHVASVYSFQSPTALAADVERLKPAVVVALEQDFSDELQAGMRQHGAAAIAVKGLEARLLPGLETSSAQPGPDAPQEPMIEIRTSGTTGPPKRFPITYEMAHRNLVERYEAEVGKQGADQMAPALLYASLANVSGMMGTLPSLVLGRRMILIERFNLEAWRDYVRTYRPSNGGLQPLVLRMLLDSDATREELSSLEWMIVGSAPLEAEVQKAFEARFGIPVLLAYGATEFYGTAVTMTPALLAQWGEAKFGSVGQPAPGFRMRVMDQETGEPAPAGQVGVIQVQNDRIGPDWIRTSDLGEIDEDGFLFLRGRADGAIVRGGFKLLPEVIEGALRSHPAVDAVAVVGVRDRRLGQVPGAAIQLEPDAVPVDFAELEKHLRRLVPATHIPVHWRFVDALPRTHSLKVDRRMVVELFAEPAVVD